MSDQSPNTGVYVHVGPTLYDVASHCYFWYEPKLLQWFIEIHAGPSLVQTVMMCRKPTYGELTCMMQMLVTRAAWEEHNDNDLD